MLCSHYLHSSLLALILLLGMTAALPANTSAIAEREEYSCFDIRFITTQYLYENTCYDPLPFACLFYTRGESEDAQVFAHRDEAQFTTIWEMWDIEHYDDNVTDTKNRYRCIMASPTDRNTYFSRMSDAMALKCDVFATVMSAQAKPAVPKGGIWYRTEYPRLKQTTAQRVLDAPWVEDNYIKQVNSIAYIKGPNGGDISNYWSREMANPPRSVGDSNRTAPAPLMRRAGCGAPSKASIFDVGGAW